MTTLREKGVGITRKRLEAELKELAAKIRRVAAAADKALRVGTLHSIKVGGLLNRAKKKHTKLKQLETRQGINLAEPRLWRDWVERECRFCIRTAQYYMKMARGQDRKEIKAMLDDPDVSARQVRLKLGQLASEGDEAVSHEPRGGKPPGFFDDDGAEEDRTAEVKRALDRLCQRFRDSAKAWPASAVIHLAEDASDRVTLLKGVTVAVEKLAKRAAWAAPRDRYRLAVLSGHIEDGDCIYTGPALPDQKDSSDAPRKANAKRGKVS